VSAAWTSGCGCCRRTPPGSPQECVPVVLSFSDEDLQVLFQFLVDPFCLSVGGRCCGFNSQLSV